MQNLQELPKLTDSISYLYIEHAVIEKSNSSIMVIQKEGRTQVPVSVLTSLFLGPGTSITHAAIQVLSASGCMVVWCGEACSKYYASGYGETRSSRNLLRQAKCCMNTELHMQVVRKMYALRFPGVDTTQMTLQQIRGMEGIRIRNVYRRLSEETGVVWEGRSYKTTSWDDSDPINQALSLTNSFLYGLCNAAIVSLGYSPGLGFIHTGKQLSFVYDVADLYKAETTIPVAFHAVQSGQTIYPELRKLCRDSFAQNGILKRIANDLSSLFETEEKENLNMENVGDLWDGEEQTTSGGVNYSEETDNGGNHN